MAWLLNRECAAHGRNSSKMTFTVSQVSKKITQWRLKNTPKRPMKLLKCLSYYVRFCTCSPLCWFHPAHEVWKTFLHFKFAPLVTAMSPVSTLPIALHSCCSRGPAAALRAFALAFFVRSRFDDVELTITST